ncbi:MAG: DUF4982 domain-containing protein [Oscillospiraceae bacterium]|nr:DUF4982 domain-containing protein [Oscillospiraceae bacterium]
MIKICFNEGWTCRHLDAPGPGHPVTIPHDAMLAEKRTELAPSGINGAWFEGYDYLYEKHFTPGPELADKRLILEFEGVYRKAEVHVNGQKLAFRPYGYTNFYVDVTDRLENGRDNLIQVISRTADQPNSRWYSGAGIYRPVHLWVSEQEHILLNGVKVRTLSTAPAKVEVTVKTSGAGQVVVDILDGSQVLVSREISTDGQAVMDLTVPNGKLWCPETPKLYTCRVRFGTDQETVTFGIRSLAWGREGFLLNGKRVILRGACIHHDNGLLGAACWADAEERKIRLLQENGYNAIRSAHNPCSKALLDACDKLGMLVMDEYIDHWYIHKTEYDYVEFFDQWWRQDLQDLVDKDYNHPSVIMYSTGNEVSETAQPKGIALTGEMTRWLHELDGTRPVTCGVNIFFNFLSSVGFGVYSDEKARKEAERAEKARAEGKQAKKAAVGSEFFNNLAGLLGDEFMKRGATLPFCDWKTRDAFANMDIAGYNYGIYRVGYDLKAYPDRLIVGSETFCKDAYRFWEQAKREKRLIGDFVWAGMDYLGEVGIGSWEYRDYAPRFDGGCGWISAGSGRLDLTGKPLGEALYTKVAFEREPGPRIGVCPVNHTGEAHSPSSWKMSNAMESWAWEGCDGKPADVEVYARAHTVALYLNGQLVGKKQPKNDCIIRFRCTYHPGKLEAVSYDANGREIGRSVLRSAGPETRLMAHPEQPTVHPGRLCFVRLKYTDGAGITKPLCRGKLKVTVTGGKLLGLGSACPYYDLSYLDDVTDTCFGEALAVIRAEDAENLTVTVSDGKLWTQAYVAVVK